jgi:hypothetical protein
LSSTGTGYILAEDTDAFPKILARANSTNGLNIALKAGADITATTTTIPANVKVIIKGTTNITATAATTVTGAGSILVPTSGTLNVTGQAGQDGALGAAVTVSVPVTVESGGTLAVKGGAGSSGGNFAGGAALVETVTAEAGSAISVIAGNGAASNSDKIGGNATIGDNSDAKKKIAFEKGAVTINVTVTGGDFGGSGGGVGGDAKLYTSNTVTSPNNVNPNAVIDGVTLTATGGAISGGGTVTVTIDANSKLITAGGSTS